MMRIMIFALWVCLLTLAAHGSDSGSPVDESGEKLGYAIGHQVGNDFRHDGAPLDPESVVAGIRDALEGTAPRWTATEMRGALRRLEESRRRSSQSSP